ncbi:MAG: site-specific DNA-methyltransferase [Pseudomonadota bacterium]
MTNKPASQNRTLTLSDAEKTRYKKKLLTLDGDVRLSTVKNRIIQQDLFAVIDWLPTSCVDLMIIDPPYNLSKNFNSTNFAKTSLGNYESWLDSWLPKLIPLLKPQASVYICSDWSSSSAIHRVAEKYLKVRNRITWEREKGRGAQRNWKNCTEDIWFCTLSNTYTFNVDDVKMKRRVVAPYTDSQGEPKDWQHEADGKFRVTHPSNVWTDISVPFWSMPENTEHPTQKPEKLIAKLILASSDPGDIVFDPFLGAGTTAVTAKKLGRHFFGVELDETYCCLAQKRLALAGKEPRIQGYEDGFFWERNTLNKQRRSRKKTPS